MDSVPSGHLGLVYLIETVQRARVINSLEGMSAKQPYLVIDTILGELRSYWEQGKQQL